MSVNTYPKLNYHHRGTEDTERSFCLSGDTDKQKDSILRALHVEHHEQIALLIPDLHKAVHEERCVMNLI